MNPYESHLQENLGLDEQRFKELRKKAVIHFVQKIFSDFKYPYIISIGMKHFFQRIAIGDSENPGNEIELGYVHLEHKRDEDGCAYFSNAWYDTFEELHAVATEIQDKKIVDENKIMEYVTTYFEDIYNPPERLYS